MHFLELYRNVETAANFRQGLTQFGRLEIYINIKMFSSRKGGDILTFTSKKGYS